MNDVVKTEDDLPSDNVSGIHQDNPPICGILDPNPPVLTKEQLYKFVRLSTDGLLNHYEPTFKNIEKDIERLNVKQCVLCVDISTELEKLRKGSNDTNLLEMISVTSHYKDKLNQLKESMTVLTERSVGLRERACRLQETKQQEALKREIKRAADQAREQHLIAKGDTSSHGSRDSLSSVKSSSSAPPAVASSSTALRDHGEASKPVSLQTTIEKGPSEKS